MSAESEDSDQDSPDERVIDDEIESETMDLAELRCGITLQRDTDS
jgi:hypothetical protein